MRASWLNAATCFTAGILLAGSPGVRPRSAASDYPAHQSIAGMTIGAALIPRGDVKKIFAADLNSGGYIVIEVGVFPAPGKEIDLSPGDFMLLTDTGRAVRTVDADTIAAAIARERQPSRQRQSDIYTSTGVVISRVPTIDPATGRRTNGTVIGTEAGVGVGAPPISAPLPPASQNRGAIEQELWAKSLPDGKTSVPVAGYLFFPKPSGKTKNALLDLVMDGPAGRARLSISER
jgi:hypothetical protein